MSIFLSYRSIDGPHAVWIYPWLIQWFGKDRVFWDRKNIEVGAAFADVIEQQIRSCAAFIAIVTPNWAGTPDAAGHRRIFAEDDWIRRETKLALAEGKLIIPVITGGTPFPTASDLPPDLHKFAETQALRLNGAQFFDLLRETLEKVVAADGGQRPAPGADLARLQRRAASLLRSQISRLQVRAVDLIQDRRLDRAKEELSEGFELLMAMLDLLPGDTTLDAVLGNLFKTTGQQLLAAGEKAQADQYLDLAFSVFQRLKDNPALLEDNPLDIASAVQGLGVIYLERGDPASAIVYFRRAIGIDPQYCYAWHDLALAYDKLGRQGGAIHLNEMREAIDRARETGLGRPGLGTDKFKQFEALHGEWAECVKAHPYLAADASKRFTEVIERGEATPQLYLYRSRARFLIERDAAGAEDDATAAIEGGMDKAETRYHRGLLRMDLENHKGAEDDFSGAIAHGRNDREVYSMRARARVKLGSVAGAEQDFTAAIEHSSEVDRSDLVGRAFLRWFQRNAQGAYEDSSAAIEEGANNASVYQIRAQSGARSGNVQHLAGDCEMAQKLDPGSRDTIMSVASMRMANREFDGAADLYKSLRRDGEDTSTDFPLGGALLLAGRTKEGLDVLTRVLAQSSRRDIEQLLADLEFWSAGAKDDDVVFQLMASLREFLAKGASKTAASDCGPTSGTPAQSAM